MKSKVGRSSHRLSTVLRYSKYREMNARNHMIAPIRTTLRTTRGRYLARSVIASPSAWNGRGVTRSAPLPRIKGFPFPVDSRILVSADRRYPALDEGHVNRLDGPDSRNLREGALEGIRPARCVVHDRDGLDRLDSECDRPLLHVAQRGAERIPDGGLESLDVDVRVFRKDPERDRNGSHGGPQGPMNEQAGQRYATDWSRQRPQRPIRLWPQLGQENTVVPFPERTAPQEEQRLSSGVTGRRMAWPYKTHWPFRSTGPCSSFGLQIFVIQLDGTNGGSRSDRKLYYKGMLWHTLACRRS